MANISNQIDKIQSATIDSELKIAIVDALSTLADADQSEAVESLKSTLLNLSEKLDTKANASEVTRIRLTAEEINKLNELKSMITKISQEMPLKANVSDVNKLKNELNAKADSSEVSRALSLKADSAPTRSLGNTFDTPEGQKALRSAVEQYATEELVTLLRSYTNEQLNLKVDQSQYDAVVGNGFQGWTLTDYIIRLREDYNAFWSQTVRIDALDTLADNMMDAASNVVSIGGTTGTNTKLYFDTYEENEGENIELAEMSDVTALENKYSKFFTFNAPFVFEAGTLDEHGWNTASTTVARTKDFLEARDFTITVPNGYNLQVVHYDVYKLFISKSLWLSGEVSYDVDSVQGTKYIKLLIKLANDATITGNINTLNALVLTMTGTDWSGSTDIAAASVGLVGTKADKTELDTVTSHIAPAYSDQSTYEVSDYVSYDGKVYKCNTAIGTAEVFTAAHWDEVVVSDELSDLKGDLGEVESFFRKTSLIEGHLNAGVTSTAISDASSKYVSVYFPVVQGRTYTIDKKYVTQYTRLGYTTTVPALLMEISDYNNLTGGGNTYRTFTAAKTGYACILIYASDVDTNVNRADIEASVVVYEGEYDSTFEARMEIVNLSNIEQMELDIERLDSRMPSVNLIEGKINASFSGQSMTLSSNSAYLTLYFPVKSGETYTIDKKQVTSYFRVAFCSDVPVIGESLSNYISASTSVKYATFTAAITGYCVVTVVASSSQHIQLYRDTVAYQGEYNPDITKTSKNITGINNLPHTFYCGPNRELSTLKAGIEEATKYMDSTLYVDAGTYDLISEFGSEFFDGLTSSDTLSGLVLKNRIHIIFSPNSKVTSHYTGSNQYAQSLYSPFNAGKYGFTLENLNLECSNCRYAVHDERNGGEEQYSSRFINCKMSIDNSANGYWTPKHCIGGGLGSNANVLIDNCIFESDDAANRYGVYYHIQNRSSLNNYRTILTIKNCYFITGTVTLDDVTNTPASISDNSEYFVYGCSFPSKYSGTDAQGVFVGLTKSYNLRIWGNEVRSAS